jgi:uncharacterized damage-inducible protein DinB
MSQRAASLADRFEQANEAVIAAVERCSDTDWTATCDGEHWSVGVTAHHVATSYAGFQSIIQGLASGAEMPPFTREMLDQSNAQHAQEFAGCTRAETVTLLRSNGQVAADTVRGLSDEQLDRGAPLALAGGQTISAAQMAEFMIGHPTDHLASIRSALGAGSALTA